MYKVLYFIVMGKFPCEKHNWEKIGHNEYPNKTQILLKCDNCGKLKIKKY